MDREQQDWKSRSVRRQATWSGSAEREDGSRIRIIACNLSYQGCAILAAEDLTIGETVTISVPRLGTLRAQVRWAVNERAGLRFLTNDSVIDERRARIGV